MKVFGIAACAACFFSSAVLAENVTLRIGAGHPPVLTYVDAWDTYFEEELVKRAAELGHTIRLVEAWGTVAKVTNVVSTVEAGALDIGLAVPSFEGSTLELYNFGLLLPFSTPDPEIAVAALQGLFTDVPELSTAMADRNITVLGMSPSENYGMAIRNVPTKPEDIDGSRIAVSGINAPWVAALGAVPVALPVNENYQAMQSGLLDGNVFFVSGMEVFRFHEAMDAFYKTDFGSLPNVAFIMNNDTRERLPEDLVALIDQLAWETAKVIATNSKARDAQFEAAVTANAELVQITPEDRQRWAQLLVENTTAAVTDLESRGHPATTVMAGYVQQLAEQGYTFPVEYPF